jgi:hypothetical protein
MHDSNAASDLISLVHEGAPYSDTILAKIEEFPLMLNTLWLNKTNVQKSNPKTIFEQYLSIIQGIQIIKVEKEDRVTLTDLTNRLIDSAGWYTYQAEKMELATIEIDPPSETTISLLLTRAETSESAVRVVTTVVKATKSKDICN